MKNPVVLGVDIGGSHITAALVDLKSGKLIQESRQRKFVKSDDAAEIILDHWCEVINEAFTGAPATERMIGIAMPGPFDYDKGISLLKEQDKFKTLYLVNIKEELAARLHIQPDAIRFINDAAAFLQGEVFGGAARNDDQVIGLTLGTGLGSAFCRNGAAVDAALWDAPFKEGIAEDYLSTRWFVGRYFELTGKVIGGVKEISLSECQDQEIGQIFKEFGHNLALFIRSLVEKEPANTVVLGGNISNAYPCFLPYLQQYLKEFQLTVQIKIAELKEDAALIGSASCWNSLIDAEIHLK